MRTNLRSFKIYKGKKILDYRSGENLDLETVRDYFQKNYNVIKIWQGARHILGLLEKDGIEYFLKLSTSEGISIVTENEYKWNNFFHKNLLNRNFTVPQNYQKGFFKKKYYYLITDYLKGKLLDSVGKYILQIINLSELIQKLPGKQDEYKNRFISKAKAWFDDIPIVIRQRYKIEKLLGVVETEPLGLLGKPRHGDFAPWHIIKLTDGKLGLIDGEHFLASGVENYDICYFIQRVFSVSKMPDIAKRIYSELLKRGYNVSKLKPVLSSRAIGGFLDESLADNPDYKFAKKFMDWVLSL